MRCQLHCTLAIQLFTRYGKWPPGNHTQRSMCLRQEVSDSPELSTLISRQVVVGAQLVSNGPKAKVEGKGEQHAQHNRAAYAEPKGNLADKSQACYGCS